MLPKSFSLLMLIVAIQFSQTFAAPRDGITQDELGSAAAADGIYTQPTQNLIGATADDKIQSMGEQVGGNVEASVQSANNQADSVVDSAPSVKEESAPCEKKAEEHFSHMLTKEQELSILHKVPEFTNIIKAMETLPDGIYDEMKAFLTSTVPKMPAGNLLTNHFENADVLVKMLERLINVARTEGQPSSEELLHRAHQAAPELKAEMDQFNKIFEEEKPEEHFSHMLTREQELNLLDKVPEFTKFIRAMEKLPDDVYVELKKFLTSTVPRMPQKNLFTKHFQNSFVLVQMFERLIKVARTEGAIHKSSSQELFDRVREAAPKMKAEMDQFDKIMKEAKSRLASLGTSTNPMDSVARPDTAGIRVTAGSVSLPTEEQSQNFANEFAPTE